MQLSSLPRKAESSLKEGPQKSCLNVDLESERRLQSLRPLCEALLAEVDIAGDDQAWFRSALQNMGVQFHVASRMAKKRKRVPPAREAALSFWACVLHRLDDPSADPGCEPLPSRFTCAGSYYSSLATLVLAESRALARDAARRRRTVRSPSEARGFLPSFSRVAAKQRKQQDDEEEHRREQEKAQGRDQ
ncbi:hypothetical protein AK812_SmicGene40917, partial [Symbiodinium microadriaticum]